MTTKDTPLPVREMNYTQLVVHVLATSKKGAMTADEIVAKCTVMRPDLFRNPNRRQLTRTIISGLWRRKQIYRTELKQSIQAPNAPIKFIYSSKRF
jgi:hypothetical protein